MRHDERHWRLAKELVRRAPEEPFPQSGVAVAAHDKQVTLPRNHFIHQHRRDVAKSLLCNPLQRRVNAVSSKIGNESFILR
jgi:hypothetical protein